MVTHDPMCAIGQTCTIGSRDGFHVLYEVRQGLIACDCCDRICSCEIIAKVRADTLNRAVSIANDQRSKFKSRDWEDAIDAVVTAIKPSQATVWDVPSLHFGTAAAVPAVASEPPIGSVVLDREGGSWQCVSAGWEDERQWACWAHTSEMLWESLRRDRGPLRVIYTPEVES